MNHLKIDNHDHDVIIKAVTSLMDLRDDYFDGKSDDFEPEKYKYISNIICDLSAVELKIEDILKEQKEEVK